MSQGFINNCFDRGHIGESDLEAMEINFAALKTMFSGASSPSSPVAFMPWGDTTNKVLRMRDASNASWISIFHGTAAYKMWVYRNDAMDGYVIDSAVADKLVAFKGGDTYTTGGAEAGTWTVNLDHLHQWYKTNQPGGNDKVWDSDIAMVNLSYKNYSGVNIHTYAFPGLSLAPSYTDKMVSAVQWRLAAAVGTLQYLDI